MDIKLFSTKKIFLNSLFIIVSPIPVVNNAVAV